MQNTLQIIRIVITTIISCIGYVASVYHAIKQNLSTWNRMTLFSILFTCDICSLISVVPVGMSVFEEL